MNQGHSQRTSVYPRATRSTAIALLMVTCFLGGCVDYPPITTNLSLAQVPDQVLATFVRTQPTAIIDRASLTTHEGHVVAYDVWFRDREGKLFTMAFGRKGEVLREPRLADYRR